jgi:hypothetical protein
MLSLRYTASLRLPRSGFLHRFSPDIVRTPRSIILCNNATNELEAYCWRTGQQQGCVSTGMRARDLIHEPRMAGNASVICLAEKQVPYIVLKYASGCNAAVPLPPSAGPPSALAVSGTHVAVACEGRGEAAALVLVRICLHSLAVSTVRMRVLVPAPVDSMAFDLSGAHLLLAQGQTIQKVKMDVANAQTLARFGGGVFLRRGHIGLGLDACENVYATDMKAAALHVFTRDGELLATPAVPLIHPTAVACGGGYVHVMDYGDIKSFAVERSQTPSREQTR